MSELPETLHRTALFAAGDFWTAEAHFSYVPGVVSTRVGYCGGGGPVASHSDVEKGATGHMECVRVVFDPARVSFAALLRLFLESHNPTTREQGGQKGPHIRSVIFYYDDAQRQDAENVLSGARKSGRYEGRELLTEILPAPDAFYEAEDYHQRYLEKRGLTAFPSRRR